MKWTDHPLQRAQPETHGMSCQRTAWKDFHTHCWSEPSSYPIGTPEMSLPFYDQNPEPDESSTPDNSPPATRAQVWSQFLGRSDWGIEDARDFARRLQIDLQREPQYSRQIFDNLLSRSAADLTQVIRFLDDPFLNTRGSGNYLAAVELIARSKAKRAKRVAVFNAVARALELGLVPPEELCLIIKALPNIRVERNKRLGDWHQKDLLRHYRVLWKAIGRCNILGYRDLEKVTVDTWMQELLRARNFRFAKEVVIATHEADSDIHWPSALIITWLKTVHSPNAVNLPSWPAEFLSLLDAECAARCIVNVTELLVSTPEDQNRTELLETWQDCLQRVSNVKGIVLARTWLDLPAYIDNVEHGSTASDPGTSAQHQIILRLWMLRSLSWSLGPPYQQDIRDTDLPIYLLLNLYEMNVQHTQGSFLADLMHGVQSLNLPCNHLLLLAADLKLRKLTTKRTRETLEQLETSKTSLADLWTDIAVYNGVRFLFFGTYERMLRGMDLTDAASVEECLRLARTGDPKSVRSLLRLLNFHTPLKLCLNKAWTPLPGPEQKALVRYHHGPRDSECPDPYAAVDLIHQLAVAFSCCPHLTPSRSFHLTRWLYGYLRRHGGPVYPSLVRAMYHAGVVRYRREGRRIAHARYEYIMWIMSKFEDRDVVKAITAPPEIGRSSPYSAA